MVAPLTRPALQAMIGGQTCFVVDHWGGSSSGDMSMVDRPTGDLLEAHVVSSKLAGGTGAGQLDLHKVVIDVDHPTYVVESSTPGHHHLYVDLPPVRWNDYVDWLQASAKIGLVEQGYVEASIRRGHSDVRLPWIHKGEGGDFLPKRPLLRCSFCKRLPIEIDEYVMMANEAEHEDDERSRAQVSDSEVFQFVWDNEGTLNRETGFFACTDCYIKQGMPSTNAGWTAPTPTPRIIES